MSLNDYFQKNIFQPLGLQNISMFPSQQMKDRLAHMHAKRPDGSIHERDHLLRAPLVADSPDGIYNSAGAGCFARPEEYCRKSHDTALSEHNLRMRQHRDPCYLTERWHIRNNGQTNPQTRDRAGNVQKPDSPISRLWTQRDPGGEARIHEPDPRVIPPAA